ncbi:MAG: polyprenyl synthetase family protein, partial [Candidatus Aminicenantaceae bacterium]
MTKLDAPSLKSSIKSKYKLKNLYNNIRNDLEEVEKNLKILPKSSNALISEVGSYLFQNAGKRIRPALLILCSKLFGYKGKEHILTSAIVETIHTASLIHDDIIDNSNMRRGKQSVHTKWGPNITVLLGDYLYIKSINNSLKSKNRQIVNILTDVSAKMIKGELDEYYFSGNLKIKENDYLNIIRKKTASLFSASCEIGGILGKASLKDKNFLIDYGINIGMSFQIIDDFLDYTGDENKLGKPILSDLSEGHITLPLIYTLNNDGKRNREHITKLIKKKSLNNENKKDICDIVQSNGSLDYMYN